MTGIEKRLKKGPVNFFAASVARGDATVAAAAFARKFEQDIMARLAGSY